MSATPAPLGGASRAFTLIELLVVVTIMVVLLAMLTPALDKAIYQAELAACGAKEKAQISSLTLYAMDYRRSYPDRPVVDARGSWRADWIRYDTNHDPNYDDRPKLNRYMDINGLLNCSLRQAVDYEIAGGDEDPHVLYAAYSLFYGWSFMNGAGTNLRGLKRLGDRFVWNAGSAADRNYYFSVLSADVDVLWDGNFYHSAHPDDQGLLGPIFAQGVPSGVLGLESKETASFYAAYGAAAINRGTVDRNFAFTDGSVERLDDLKAADEDRVVEVPVGPTTAGGFPRPYRTSLPPR
jgi:prepilin-type N-terminal cleavage/methylation domain-containing protein